MSDDGLYPVAIEVHSEGRIVMGAVVEAQVHLIGGADVATELDAKRAFDQGTLLAAAL